MSVVRYALFVVCCLSCLGLFVVCCLSFVVFDCLLRAIGWLFVVYCLVRGVRCSVFVSCLLFCCLLSVVSCSMFGGCCSLLCVV